MSSRFRQDPAPPLAWPTSRPFSTVAYPRFQNVKEHANIFLESLVAPHSFEDKAHSSTQHSPLWSGPISPSVLSSEALPPAARTHTVPQSPCSNHTHLPEITLLLHFLHLPALLGSLYQPSRYSCPSSLYPVNSRTQRHLLNTSPYSLQLMRCSVGFQKKCHVALHKQQGLLGKTLASELQSQVYLYFPQFLTEGETGEHTVC